MPTDRRAVYQPPLLWESPDGRVPEEFRLRCQPQARSAADAAVGAGRYGPGAAYQPTPSWAQGVSLPATGASHRTAQPGVEHGHHLHSPGPGFRVLGGDPRLVQPQGAGVGS